MRPIPATRLGDAHGLLRAIEKRGRLRTDEFVTEFNLDELFPPGLENALGRLRHFISFGRLAGLVKEDRGVVELTEIGKRYVRSEDPDAVFDVSSQQAEWLRRQLRERHMTDSIFHGLAIGLSLLASVPPGTRISTMDFGRSMAYLGRAGWDNENTLLIQGERHLTLLTDLELIDADHRLTPTGEQLRGELTLPVHMSLADIAAQLNPGGAAAVRVGRRGGVRRARPGADARSGEEARGQVGRSRRPARTPSRSARPTPPPRRPPRPPCPPGHDAAAAREDEARCVQARDHEAGRSCSGQAGGAGEETGSGEARGARHGEEAGREARDGQEAGGEAHAARVGEEAGGLGEEPRGEARGHGEEARPEGRGAGHDRRRHRARP